MKSKKVTMLAAALVVAVVALAGVGYAATTYKATTSNSGNTMESTYITLAQGGQGSYAVDKFFTSIYFDTVNKTDANTFYYTPVYTHKLDNHVFVPLSDTVTVGDYACVTDPIQLTISKVNSTDTSVEIVVTPTTLTPVNGLEYTMVLDGAAEGISDTYSATFANGKWTFDSVALGGDNSTNLTASITYDVYIFISLKSDAPEEGALPGEGQNIATAGFSTTTTFDFVAKAGIANP
jgi:hypothetical protein